MHREPSLSERKAKAIEKWFSWNSLPLHAGYIYYLCQVSLFNNDLEWKRSRQLNVTRLKGKTTARHKAHLLCQLRQMANLDCQWNVRFITCMGRAICWYRTFYENVTSKYILVRQCFRVGYRGICHASLVFSVYTRDFRRVCIQRKYKWQLACSTVSHEKALHDYFIPCLNLRKTYGNFGKSYILHQKLVKILELSAS